MRLPKKYIPNVIAEDTVESMIELWGSIFIASGKKHQFFTVTPSHLEVCIRRTAESGDRIVVLHIRFTPQALNPSTLNTKS